MTSARKKASETMARTDVVVEVLDARIPEASSNPMIRELRLFRQRPCLKVLNKADLADPEATRAWLAHFNAQPGVTAVALSCKKPGGCDTGAAPVPVAGAAPQRWHETLAHPDHGHSERGQVDADECTAQAPCGEGG
jgi:Predicted GTPases